MIYPNYSLRLTAKQNSVYSFRTGFLTRLVTFDVNQWTKITAKLHSDLFDQNLLIFPVDLISNKWSFFVAVALPYVGKKTLKTPMLCHFDPIGSSVDEAAITTMSEKIRQLLNIMWRNKFSSKVDKIENPFNKRTLPLKCLKGEHIGIASILFHLCGNLSKLDKFPPNLMNVRSFEIDDQF